MSQRIIWIDNAKCIGMYLVVLGHSPLADYFKIFIYSFHMPLFFILSGYLYKTSLSLREYVKKNVLSLLIPYIIYYLISYFYTIFYDIFYHSFDYYDTLLKPFYGMLYGNGYSGIHYTMLNIPLYFLIALFWIRILFFFFQKKTKYQLFGLISVCIIFVIALKKTHWDLYFSLDSAILGLPFFVFGFVLNKKQVFQKIVQMSIIKKIVIAGVTLACFLPIVFFNGRVDVNHCIYGKSILLYYLVGILGSFFVSLISSILGETKFAHFISKGTMVIIAFGSAAASLFLYLGLGSFSSAFFTLVFLLPFIVVIERKFPILLGKC